VTRRLAVALVLATACHANAPAARPAPTTAAPSTTAPSPAPIPTPTVSLGPDGLVVVHDAKGAVVSESTCYDDYEPGVRLMTALQRALRAGDRAAVERLVSFPLTWRDRAIGRAELDRRYAEVFTRDAVARITAADPHALFCRQGAFMIGDGIVWGTGDGAGHYLVETVNS
jgi:hypothetical protein